MLLTSVEISKPRNQLQMHFHTQSVTNQLLPSLAAVKPAAKTQSTTQRHHPFPRFSFSAAKCSFSAISELTHVDLRSVRPFPAEISRTILELSSVGTLSTLTQDGWPLGIGVRFAVDQEGTPILCSNDPRWKFFTNKKSSLHVQLEQGGLRTPQCTIQGSLDKPNERMITKQLNSVWKKRFGEEVDEDLLFVVNAERILQMEDFMEVGLPVNLSDYKTANPDPLRDFAEKLANEINTNNIEDVNRFCNVYVDLDFQVTEAKLIWVDRLGFDLRALSPEKGLVEIRIPFPREVTDEKGAKSAFNGMSQLAWEVEKHFHSADFHKVKHFKLITNPPPL